MTADRKRCNVCGAYLAGDHDEAWRCSSHRLPFIEDEWKPRLDSRAKEKVLGVLMVAHDQVVDLRYALGTSDRHALRDLVRKLRRDGYRIDGCRPAGYRLVSRECGAGARHT